MKKTSMVVVAALVALTASASAGRKDGWSVVVDLANKHAYGSLGSARNSPDGVQQIGCAVFYDRANARNQVSCIAVDLRGRALTCASQDPNLVQIGTAVGSDSYVEFRADEAGECTMIFVNNSSTVAPKAP